MNKTVLIGRMVSDPELKFIPGSGTATCSFRIAVNRKYKKEGQPEADFIPVVVWGRMAENVAQYMAKGRQIGICGRIETRSYENKEGNRVYVTEVIAEDVEFLGNKTDGGATTNTTPEYGNDVTPVDSEDIPF